MTKSTLRIVSDGTSVGTKVFAADGQEIKGISSITIRRIRPGGFVAVSLEMVNVSLDVCAQDESSVKRFEDAAVKTNGCG